MKASGRHPVFRFSVFELDPNGGELRKNGSKLKIQDQPLQILLLLLERPGEIITREQIQQRLWPEGTFVDFEHGVNTAIKKLRETLRDSADNPRFIETIPRRGYRFLDKVEVDSEEGTSGTPDSREVSGYGLHDPSPPEMNFKGSRLRGLAIAGGIFAAGLILIVVLKHDWTSKNISDQSSIPAPLVALPGTKSFPSLSPSAQQLVFSWDGGSGTSRDIYEKEVGTEHYLRLTNSKDSDDIDPVWSPDGREIAFARISRRDPGIYFVSALGGAERRILATNWKNVNAEYYGWGRIDWSPDGRFLVYSDRDKLDEPDSLFLLSLDTLVSRKLTSPKFQTGDLSPRFSPDGKSIAFIRDMKGAGQLYVIAIKGGAERLIAGDNKFKNGIAWSADGRSIVCSGSWLSRVSIENGQVQRLPFGQQVAHLSIRGTRLAFSQAWEIYKVVSRSLLGGEAETTVLSSTRYDSGPQFSPDGARLAFESNRSGTFQIWICNRDGTGIRQLTNMNTTWTGTPRWSPDGKLIVFDSRPNGNADIFVMDPEAGEPKAITTETSNEVVPSWSRDGRWIYFASDRTGGWEVFKKATSGGPAIQVTHSGGFSTFEAWDGTVLYYTKGLFVPGLWQVSLNDGKETELIKMPEAGYWGFWAPVKGGIYYLDTSASPTLEFLDPNTHEIKHILDLHAPAAQTPGMGISPDGKTLLYTQIDQTNSEIDLVENFH